MKNGEVNIIIKIFPEESFEGFSREELYLDGTLLKIDRRNRTTLPGTEIRLANLGIWSTPFLPESYNHFHASRGESYSEFEIDSLEYFETDHQEKFETEGEVNVRKRITSFDRGDLVIRFELREEEDQPITENSDLDISMINITSQESLNEWLFEEEKKKLKNQRSKLRNLLALLKETKLNVK